MDQTPGHDIGSEGQAATPPSPDGPKREPKWLEQAPEPETAAAPGVPESTRYRLKRILLGPPLVSDALHTERLGRPTALAVLSSDVMSSCAYATESILRILVPVVGLAAFSLITPITAMILVLLGIVCLCYRQVVGAYPVSGGSYVVSRDNFGFATAQIPGAALIVSYILTVAVSIAAGVDAVISAFPVLAPYPVELAVGCVLLLTYGNLRGIREAGKVFAVPTYWFLASMGCLVLVGLGRLAANGHLPRIATHVTGQLPLGTAGGGLLLGASVFIFLRAFANGGSAMTGMEAISNAVTIFRAPQVRNARSTLITMAMLLGAMFLSVSVFAALTHAVPYESGTPTVLSELGRDLFGSSTLGKVPYYSLQFSTALILILGANTSYNGFPLLVSFIAEDAYLPRPFTARGHRLVYSNGILALTVTSIVLLVVTRARVASLIPLYACAVFTGFTMAGAGMTKYHLTHDEPHRRKRLFISVMTFVTSAAVTMVFVVTEFTKGAWLVVVAVPTIVFLLTRTHRRYEEERQILGRDSGEPAPAERILRHHIVLVLVDTFDLATVRAIQLARSIALHGEIRAVHFVIDAAHAKHLVEEWTDLGPHEMALELIDCPDRRLARAATELTTDLASDGETEVTLVLPRRIYRGVANRLLHSNTADRIVAAVSTVPNVSATTAPFDVGGALRKLKNARHRGDPKAPKRIPDPARARGSTRPIDGATRRAREMTGAVPISDAVHRQRMRFAGRIRSVRTKPWSGQPALECTMADETGAINLVFLGRQSIPGIEPGSLVSVEGMVGRHAGRLAMINPLYELLEGGTSSN